MPRHALIVDDSRTACRTLAVLLEKHGIDSTSVYSAEAALEELRHRKPDVIFMDQSMPGMDGLETVKIIKGNPETATIPVMMYTAKEGDVYLGQARALGALDVLPKGQLKEKLDQALEKLHFSEQEQAARLPASTVEADPERAHAPLSPPAARRQPPPVERERDRDADLRRQLQSLRSELSRQLYMVLTEDQITQKEYARWLLDGVDKRVDERISALEETLTAHESQQETERQRVGRRRHGTVVAVCGLVTGLCLALLWQVSAVGRDGDALHANVAALAGQLTALQEAVSRGTDSGPPGGGSGAQSRLGVVGDGGEPVGVLLGLDDTGQYFAALSRTNYVFHINPTGEIGVPLHRKYFAVPNCNGQALTHGQGGVLFRDMAGRLLYTPKEATALSIRPASVMAEEERCEAMDAGEIPLRPIRANDPEVTGISLEAEPVHLVQH